MCEKSAANEGGAFAGMAEVVERLQSARSVLLMTHARPDGDGLGCMVALARGARAAGKSAWLLSPDPVPTRYASLLAGEQPGQARDFAAMASRAELLVVVDTRAFAQLDGLEELLPREQQRLVVIDHHLTGDHLGDLEWVDSSAAAAGVMALELLEALNWPIDAASADALATAIVSDTGWLRYANTDARCLSAMARLVERGVRPDELYRELYQSDRPQRLALMARMLESMELHGQGRLAVMTIHLEDFEQIGARPDETEDLVNEALRVGSVETVALLVENERNVRVSLRSRSKLDVAAVAGQFGGGGHARAAGVRCSESIDDLKPRLVAACLQAMGLLD